MSNNISNNVGRTAGRRYSADDASFDHASYADYHEYLQSMCTATTDTRISLQSYPKSIPVPKNGK